MQNAQSYRMNAYYNYSCANTTVLYFLQLEDWHSGECKLMPTLTFDLLTPNKMGDQGLSWTIHLLRLVMIRPVVFVLER